MVFLLPLQGWGVVPAHAPELSGQAGWPQPGSGDRGAAAEPCAQSCRKINNYNPPFGRRKLFRMIANTPKVGKSQEGACLGIIWCIPIM